MHLCMYELKKMDAFVDLALNGVRLEIVQSVKCLIVSTPFNTSEKLHIMESESYFPNAGLQWHDTQIDTSV